MISSAWHHEFTCLNNFQQQETRGLSEAQSGFPFVVPVAPGTGTDQTLIQAHVYSLWVTVQGRWRWLVNWLSEAFHCHDWLNVMPVTSLVCRMHNFFARSCPGSRAASF